MDLKTCESNWDELIPSILFAYRTLKQESIKYTPFYLVHDREVQLLIDIEFQDQEQNLNPIENFEKSLNRRISALKGIFIDTQIINHRNIQHAQEFQRNRQQNLKKAQTYEVNDIILLYDSAK
ncbi:8322_t:CDS:2 [Diversispora eburnea]|uniref:8322_t:CDS:1 n=1 Tax=Diversispora eburnea TaxID=1213867 RepID=A0A9N9CJI2_9GLOM|nr:8322_t:CDS:2 [Diversispora eburnea]